MRNFHILTKIEDMHNWVCVLDFFLSSLRHFFSRPLSLIPSQLLRQFTCSWTRIDFFTSFQVFIHIYILIMIHLPHYQFFFQFLMNH